MQPLIRSWSISTAPSLARYCGNCPQTPISGMVYGWLPAPRWQFWQARLLPANRIPGSDTAGPISFAVSAKSACPYLTSFPNGSSPTMAISGGVHCVRSILMGSAAGEARAVEPIKIDLTQWTPPDIAMVGDDPFGKLVKYRHALFADTANEIGPAVSDPGMRFAANNLAFA